MKRKLLNLLMMLTLGVSGAWADSDPITAFSQDFTAKGESTDPADYGFTVTGSGSATVEGGKLNVVGGGNSGSDVNATAIASFTPITSAFVNISFDWSTGNSSGTRGKAAVSILDSDNKEILVLSYEAFSYKVNGVQVEAGANNNTKSGTVQIRINLLTKRVESLSYGSYTSFSKTNLEFKDATASNNVAKLKVYDNTKAQWKNTTTLDNVSVVYEPVEASTHSYTINAICASNILKELSSGSEKEGENYAYNGLPYVIEKDGQFYILNDNQATNFSKSFVMGQEDATVSVNYTLDNGIVSFSEIGTGDDARYSGGGNAASNAKLATVTVAPGVYRAEVKVISNGSSGKNHRTEGVYVGSTMVGTTDNSDKLFTFDFPVIADNSEVYVRGCGSSNYSDNLDYVLIRKIGESSPITPGSDATWVIMNPNIDGSTSGWTAVKTSGGNGPYRTNNNQMEYWAGNATDRDAAGFDYYQTIINLPNGYYTLSADMCNSLNGEAGAEFNESCGLYAVSGDNSVMSYVTTEGGEPLTNYTTQPILVENGTLRIGVKSDKRMGARWFVADNFRLTYVGNEFTLPVTIGSYGYATYVTPYNMDFTDSKITAYAVSSNIENDMVTITPVDGQKVPAGTALVLKGETDNINVTAEAVGAVATDLTYSNVAITDDTKDADKTYYYLGVENGTVVFRPLAAGGTLAAGKCFFTVDASAGAKSLRIAFDNDSTTGVTVTEANAVKANGKYVENGQIVIINNGKKYNVVGIMK